MEIMEVVGDNIQNSEVKMEQVFQDDHVTETQFSTSQLHAIHGEVEPMEISQVVSSEDTSGTAEATDQNMGHVVQIIMQQNDDGESLMSGAHLIQLDTGQGVMQQYLQVQGEDGEKQLIQVETSSDGQTHLVFQEATTSLLDPSLSQPISETPGDPNNLNLPSAQGTMVKNVPRFSDAINSSNPSSVNMSSDSASTTLTSDPAFVTLNTDHSIATETADIDATGGTDSTPIALTSDSEVIINGKKCVLKIDEKTGQLAAFPVKTAPSGRKRGRPRKQKASTESSDTLSSDQTSDAQPAEFDHLPTSDCLAAEKETSAVQGLLGLSELEDGRRKSNRSRKKNSNLTEYETGAIDGIEDDIPDAGTQADGPAVPAPPGLSTKYLTGVKRGPGRPPKSGAVTNQLQNFLASLGLPVKRGRGRPRRKPPLGASTSFLIPSGSGQAVVMAPVEGLSLPKLAPKLVSIQPKVTPDTQPVITDPPEETEKPAAAAAAAASASGGSLNEAAAKQDPEYPAEPSTAVVNTVSSSDNLDTQNSSKPAKYPSIIVKNKDGTETLIYTQSSISKTIKMLSSAFDEQEQETAESITKTEDGDNSMISHSKFDDAEDKKRDAHDNNEVNDNDNDDSNGSGDQNQILTQPSQDTALENAPVIDESAEVSKSTALTTQDAEAITVSFIEGGNKVTGEETSTPTAVIQLPQHLVPLIMPRKDPPKLGLRSSEGELAKLKCPKCSFQAFYLHQFNQHLTKHADELYRCKCCTMIALSQEQLVQHFREFHPRNICPTCDFMAEQQYAIRRHVIRHNDTKSRECEICGKVYKDQYVLKMHIKLVHMPADVLFECNICNKKFTRKAHLKRHLRIHEPEKPFKCPHCDYRGCERSDITKHVPIHEAPKYTCEVCNKSFRHLKNKELHIKRHKGQRDYKCGVCDFYGYTFTDIRKHIERKHSDSRHFYYCKCGLYFRSEAALREHRQRCDGGLSVGLEMTVGDSCVDDVDAPHTLTDSATSHVLVDTHPNDISIEQVHVLTDAGPSVSAISGAEFIETHITDHIPGDAFHSTSEIADITEIIDTQHATPSSQPILGICEPRDKTSSSPLPGETLNQSNSAPLSEA